MYNLRGLEVVVHHNYIAITLGFDTASISVQLAK